MKRERHIGRFLLALAVACSVGLYVGHSLGETVKAQEDAQVHIVDQGKHCGKSPGPSRMNAVWISAKSSMKSA